MFWCKQQVNALIQHRESPRNKTHKWWPIHWREDRNRNTSLFFRNKTSNKARCKVLTLPAILDCQKGDQKDWKLQSTQQCFLTWKRSWGKQRTCTNAEGWPNPHTPRLSSDMTNKRKVSPYSSTHWDQHKNHSNIIINTDSRLNSLTWSRAKRNSIRLFVFELWEDPVCREDRTHCVSSSFEHWLKHM